jgi:hypothetical protein
MKPQTIGRVLGIGVRVTGRLIGRQLTASLQPSAPISASPGSSMHSQVIEGQRHAAQAVGTASRRMAKGAGGFLAPFRRIGGILWLEVTGVFFFLPVVVFAPTLWRIRASYAHGPDHNTFMLTAGVILVFFYLSVSSFWRARRR